MLHLEALSFYVEKCMKCENIQVGNCTILPANNDSVDDDNNKTEGGDNGKKKGEEGKEEDGAAKSLKYVFICSVVFGAVGLFSC
jgi:hypothetical protein